MKKLFRESWRDLLGVAVAASCTESVLARFGWPDSVINHLLVFVGIIILTGVLIAIIEITIKAIRHDTERTDTAN